MTPMAGKRLTALEKQIHALPEDVRDRVVERAAILWESGVPDEGADRLAYEMETGQALPGVVRARARRTDAAPSAETAEGEAAPPTVTSEQPIVRAAAGDASPVSTRRASSSSRRRN